MTGFLEVRNLTVYQHYKQRRPPWIKLYASLLDDYDFGRLPDSAKWHLLGIFLLASQHGNVLPADPKWIARMINTRSKVDLSRLRHWLDPVQKPGPVAPLASNMLAPCKQLASPETETETETYTKESSSEAEPGDDEALLDYARSFYPGIALLPTARPRNLQTCRRFIRAYTLATCKAGICLTVERLSDGDTGTMPDTQPATMGYFKPAIAELHRSDSPTYQRYITNAIEKRRKEDA